MKSFKTHFSGNNVAKPEIHFRPDTKIEDDIYYARPCSSAVLDKLNDSHGEFEFNFG